MPITPLPPYVASFLPLSNITPFTYKDGETYLKELERMEKYIFGTLVPYVQDNFESLGEDFQTQVNLVITTVNEQLALQDAAVTAELAAQLATLTAELALKADLVAGKVPDAQLPARVIGLTPGSGITVDATDPTHPIVTNSGVIGAVAGTGIGVDNTDPHHPIISNTGVRGVTAGAHATVDNTDPEHPIVSGTGIVEAIVAGTNVVVNNADPTHPIVSASGGGGGGGIVDTVVGSTHISVNSTDPANPVVSATGLVIGVSAGTGVTVDNTDPTHPVVSSAADGVLGITPGAHISVDNTDPAHPVVAATGLVDSVTAGSNITVDNTDPNNPIVATVAKVTTVVGSANVTVNATDPNNPVVSSVAKVTAVVAGTNITVDNTDPHNPIVAAATPAFVAPESATDPGSPVEGTVYANTRGNRLVPYINGAFRRQAPMVTAGHANYTTYCKVNALVSSGVAFAGDTGSWGVSGTTGFAIAAVGNSFPALLPSFLGAYMDAFATAGTAAVVALKNNATIGPLVPATLTSPVNKMKYHARLRGGHSSGVVNANNRFFMGWSIDAGGATDTQPSADLGFFGIGWDAADTLVQIMHNDASGTATKVATTINAGNKTAPTQLRQLFDLEADIYYNGTAWQVDLTVTDILLGTTQSVSFTTDIYGSDATVYIPVIKASSGGISWAPGVTFVDHLLEVIVN